MPGVLILVLWAMTGLARAECPPPKLAWTATYNSPANSWDGASAVVVDASGNVVVAGREDRFDLGQGLNWLIRKYDSDGILIWSQSYNSPANRWDGADAMAIDPAGNVVVAGREDQFDIGQGFNWLIRKYDSAGNVLWSKSYNSPGNRWDGALAVAVDPNGYVVAAGREDRLDLGQQTNWLIRKYTPDGVLVWSKTYNGPADQDDWANAVAVDANGNVFVAGREERSDLEQGFDWLIRKYDSAGNLLWSRGYNSLANSNDWANALVVDARGDVIVAGREDRPDLEQGSNWLVRKYTSDGELLWSKTVDSAENSKDGATAVAVDSKRNVIVAGREDRSDIGQSTNWLIRKYTPAGKLVWSKTYNSEGNGTDWANAVAVDPEGNAVVAGREDRSDLGQGFNWRIRKYSSSAGTLIWNKTYNSPANRWGGANAVAVDTKGNAVVAGYADRSDLGEGFNWLVHKYDRVGKLIWSKSYNSRGNGNDWASAVAIDQAGDVVVAGREDRVDLGQGFNWRIRKYTSKGKLVWSKTYNSLANRWDGASAVAIDAHGNVIVAGSEFRSDLGQGHNWLVRKYTRAGKLVWSKTHNGPADGWDVANAIATDDQGNVVVVGREDQFDLGESFNWLIRKYDRAGRLIWSKSYNSPANSWDGANAVAVDSDGNVIVVGREDRVDLGQGTDWLIRKYGAAGKLAWSERYNNPANGNDWANAVVVDRKGQVIVAGREDRFDLGQGPNWLIRKYTGMGKLMWSRSYNSPANSWDGANAVTVDLDDNVIVAGSEFRPDLGQGHNWLVRKYDRTGVPPCEEL